jgi:hypothetical protein
MKTQTNEKTMHSNEFDTNEWFYENLSGSPYISWVCAFKRGALTYGQVKYRVRGWIRELGKNRGRPTVSYQEWLEWMKENHDNSYDHILG